MRSDAPSGGRRGHHAFACSAAFRSGKRNSKPAASNRLGSTRALESSASSAISPSASRSAKAGMGTTAGRPSSCPRAATKSRLRSGSGAVTLTGPESPLSGQRGADHSEHVGHRHPAEPLLAVAEWSPEPQFEGSDHLGECATVAREDDSESGVDHPNTGRARGIGCRLPVAHQLGKKAASRSGGLVEQLVAAIAVEADRRRTNEGRRRLLSEAIAEASRCVEAVRLCRSTAFRSEPSIVPPPGSRRRGESRRPSLRDRQRSASHSVGPRGCRSEGGGATPGSPDAQPHSALGSGPTRACPWRR